MKKLLFTTSLVALITTSILPRAITIAPKDIAATVMVKSITIDFPNLTEEQVEQPNLLEAIADLNLYHAIYALYKLEKDVCAYSDESKKTIDAATHLVNSLIRVRSVEEAIEAGDDEYYDVEYYLRSRVQVFSVGFNEPIIVKRRDLTKKEALSQYPIAAAIYLAIGPLLIAAQNVETVEQMQVVQEVLRKLLFPMIIE